MAENEEIQIQILKKLKKSHYSGEDNELKKIYVRVTFNDDISICPRETESPPKIGVYKCGGFFMEDKYKKIDGTLVMGEKGRYLNENGIYTGNSESKKRYLTALLKEKVTSKVYCVLIKDIIQVELLNSSGDIIGGIRRKSGKRKSGKRKTGKRKSRR